MWGASSRAHARPITREMGSRRRSTIPLGLNETMRSAVLENLSDGVYFVDRQRRILYWNRGAELITGFAKEEVLGRRCKDNILNHCDDAGRNMCGKNCPLLATMRDRGQREAHLFLHHKDGHRKPVCVRAAPLTDEDGRVIGAVETFHDDSALVNTLDRASELERRSTSDPLTGTGNRRLGEAMLAGWLEQYRRSGQPFGVLFADIDRFKAINDQFGHIIGDDALRVVARTLVDVSRAADHVIRWGGEEFLILIACADNAALREIGERLRVLVQQARVTAGRKRVPLTLSIGGTISAPGDTPELIVRRSDALMYQSKRAGRNRVTIERECAR